MVGKKVLERVKEGEVMVMEVGEVVVVIMGKEGGGVVVEGEEEEGVGVWGVVDGADGLLGRRRKG